MYSSTAMIERVQSSACCVRVAQAKV